MLSPAQLSELTPGWHRDMDGDMDQRLGSLDLSAQWHGWEANLRYNLRDYGIYAATPPYDEGTRIRLDTLHASLGYAHSFSDDLDPEITGIYSAERYDTYQYDFLLPQVHGDQLQKSQRWELGADLHWRPTESLDTILGYRLLHIDGVENQVDVVPLLAAVVSLEPVTTQDLFAQASWHVAPPLRLIGGVRVSFLPDEYRSWDWRSTGQGLLYKLVSSDDSTLVNGQLALIWSLTLDQVLKLSWGTASQDNDTLSLPEPERIETLEASYSLNRARWRLSVGLFQNDLSHLVTAIQRFDPATGAYLTLSDNSGGWRAREVELIGEAHPVQSLGLSASLTWQRTEDTVTGIDPGNSPALLAKLEADWRQGPMTYAAYGYYVDGMDADWDFVSGPAQGVVIRLGERVPAYWNLGLNLRWDPSGAGPYADLNVSNLLEI